jgi:hypothetical protein
MTCLDFGIISSDLSHIRQDESSLVTTQTLQSSANDAPTLILVNYMKDCKDTGLYFVFNAHAYQRSFASTAQQRVLIQPWIYCTHQVPISDWYGQRQCRMRNLPMCITIWGIKP